jgi:1,4-alpha-glucan branching enzyme
LGSHFGVDGFRLDATNRMPWEMHEQIATFGQELARTVGKPLYLLSEYAESEDPKGRRAPTGHQYADQTGRFLMKLLELTTAAHVTGLPDEAGSVLRPMLKAARRGWWYPDVPPRKGALRGGERSTTLLWNHDWIGNRFGGERLNHLVAFPVFKTILVWQFLGQWTPFLFMGTERSAETPWFFFTGHKDTTTNNNVSAYYGGQGGKLVLKGGRFHELQAEVRAAGLKEAIAFSADGTLEGVDWAFRNEGLTGRPHMTRQQGTAEAKSSIRSPERKSGGTRRLFRAHKGARAAAVKNEDPRDTGTKHGPKGALPPAADLEWSSSHSSTWDQGGDN